MLRPAATLIRLGNDRYSPKHRETGLSPFLLECAKQGKTGRFEVLSIERVQPPRDVADRLNVSGSARSVLRRENVFYADDTAGSIAWAGFLAAERQLAATGCCQHPIRLRGRIDAIDLATGELAPVYDSTAEPGGVLLTACGNRRESVCSACSQVYKRDARQLVRAGLSGGKGMPETVATHPCVFATLTAPSFGPVHARRKRGTTVLPCRPRRDHKQRRCPHGRDISCPRRHNDDDPVLGRPMCPDCYDYTAAVLFNACAGELWRRFTTYLPRHFARLTGQTITELRRAVAIRYVKVAEYQARGVVHFHAIIRLDAPGDTCQPPDPFFTAVMLCDAIGQAAATAASRTTPTAKPTPGAAPSTTPSSSSSAPGPTQAPATPPPPTPN